MTGNIKKPGMQVFAEVRNGNVAEALEEIKKTQGLETRSLRVKTEGDVTYLFIRDKSVGLEFFNGGYKKRKQERNAAIELLFENGTFKNKIHTTKKNEGNNGQSPNWTRADFDQQGMVYLGDVGVEGKSDDDDDKEEMKALRKNVVKNLDDYTDYDDDELVVINVDDLSSEEEGVNTSPSSPNTPRAQQEPTENSSQTSAKRTTSYPNSWKTIPEGNNPTTVPKLTLSRQTTQSPETPVTITTPRGTILEVRKSQYNMVIPPEDNISIAFATWRNKRDEKTLEELTTSVVNPLFDLLIKDHIEVQKDSVKKEFDNLKENISKDLLIYDDLSALKNTISRLISEAINNTRNDTKTRLPVTTPSPRKPVQRQNANKPGTVVKLSDKVSKKIWSFAMNLQVQNKAKIYTNLATWVEQKVSEKDEIDLRLNEAEAVVTLTVTAQKNNKKTEYPVSIQALSQDSFDVGSVDQKQPKSTRAPLIKRKATQNLNVKSSSDRIYYPIPTGTFEDDPEK